MKKIETYYMKKIDNYFMKKKKRKLLSGLETCSPARDNVTFSFISSQHYETRLFKYIENFTSKNWNNFQIKKTDLFYISAQNIDCGYSLEPPRRGGSNEYQQAMFPSKNKKNNVYPFKPQFNYIKVGFKGVKII